MSACDRPEGSLDELNDSKANALSVEGTGENGKLMDSTETKNPTRGRKLPKLSDEDSDRSAVRRQRVITVLIVVMTSAIAILSYYGGRFHERKLGKQGIVEVEEERPQMIMQTLWATPLARTHLRTHPSRLNLTEFNKRLEDAVAEDYAAILANFSQEDPTVVNDLFFEHQTGSVGEKSEVVRARVDGLAHRKLEEFETLAHCAATLAERVIEKFGKAAIRGCEKRLQGWATLHDSAASRHGLHVHVESTLSIVYYVRMGEGAPLRLYDPRGPRPPFETSIELWPTEGEMVAFPGWLAHEVDNGSGRRVSIVFNVPGNWDGHEFAGETVGLGRWGKAKGWKLDFSEGEL